MSLAVPPCLTDVQESSTRIVGVIQGMEPRCLFSEGIDVHRKRRLAQRAHVHQDRQLQLQYSCPLVELAASLHLLLVPISKLQLLGASVTQLVNAVVVGMLLQGEKGCCCHLMHYPGSTDT